MKSATRKLGSVSRDARSLQRLLFLPLVLGLAFLYTFGVESYACHDHGTESPDHPCAVCQIGSAHKVILPENPVFLADPNLDATCIRPDAVEAPPHVCCLSVTRPRAPPTS